MSRWEMCHYCSEPATKRIRTYVRNSWIRRLFGAPKRRAVSIGTCALHMATPIVELTGMHALARRAWLRDWQEAGDDAEA